MPASEAFQQRFALAASRVVKAQFVDVGQEPPKTPAAADPAEPYGVPDPYSEYTAEDDANILTGSCTLRSVTRGLWTSSRTFLTSS